MVLFRQPQDTPAPSGGCSHRGGTVDRREDSGDRPAGSLLTTYYLSGHGPIPNNTVSLSPTSAAGIITVFPQRAIVQVHRLNI